MASFYCLPTATRPLMPIRYSLVVLGIECLLWLYLSLIDVNPVRNNETQQRKGTQDRSMDRFK